MEFRSDDTESDTESSSPTNSVSSLSFSSEPFASADSEPSSPSPTPNSGSSSLTQSEPTDSTSFSTPASRSKSASSNLIFFGEYRSADSGSNDDQSHDRIHDQIHDQSHVQSLDQSLHQRDALRAHLDCNICYNDPLASPVITYCGHIFCWPCLYEWLQDRAKPCPVCRTILTTGINIVPIYCSSTSGPSDPSSSALIPPRPNPPISTQFPSQTEVLRAIDILLTETQRLHVEQRQNCESMTDHFVALSQEMGELRELVSQMRVDRGSTPEGEMESTHTRIRAREMELSHARTQESIDRTGDSMLQSRRVRRLLNDIGVLRGRLGRV